MSVLGLDFSLNSTGYAEIMLDGSLGAYGTIKPRQVGLPRLAILYTSMNRLIHALKPSIIACENYSFGSPFKATAIGEGGGVFRLAFHQAGYVEGKDLFFVSPKSLKLYVTGNGNADKAEMIAAILKRWHVDFGKKNDEADAFSLATVAALLARKSTTGMSASEKAMLEKIRPK
jgi:Holliday junction resolvasome RuvABC endonuclease subunit